MDVLIRFGLTIEEIQNMTYTNEEILQVEDEALNKLINILKDIGCSTNSIKNILLCNPFYLTSGVAATEGLIQMFKKLGFSSLYVLFDSNPYILNMSSMDLENLYNQKIEEGLTKDEIINFVQNNMIF